MSLKYRKKLLQKIKENEVRNQRLSDSLLALLI
jgi:heme exporter protein D